MKTFNEFIVTEEKFSSDIDHKLENKVYPYISMNNANNTLWLKVNALTSFKTTEKLTNYLDGKDLIISGLEAPIGMDQSVAIKRAKKILEPLGYKIKNTHKIVNRGFENETKYWISVEK